MEDRQVAADAVDLPEEIEVPEVNEVDDAAEEAAFLAGFNDTDLEPEPTPEPEPEPDPAPEAEPAKSLTIDDLAAIIEQQKQEAAKMRDTFFGKLGNLQQKIDSAKGSVSGISPKARERLQADFPELAEMLFDGASDPEPVAPEPFEYTPVEDRVEKVKQEFEMKLLARDHKDWDKVVGSQEFATWKDNVLDPMAALELENSWDSDFVSGKITEFKEWHQSQLKKQEQDKIKKQRLENAVTPKGIPRSGNSDLMDDDEDAAMEAAFRKR